ncbi:hypothetical protein [Marinomonas rhizomae]|nr:hypothetical protein [Marinomonas rhizomae]
MLRSFYRSFTLNTDPNTLSREFAGSGIKLFKIDLWSYAEAASVYLVC